MKTLHKYLTEELNIDIQTALKIVEYNNKRIDKLKNSILESSSYSEEEDRVIIHHDQGLLIYKFESIK